MLDSALDYISSLMELIPSWIKAIFFSNWLMLKIFVSHQNVIACDSCSQEPYVWKTISSKYGHSLAVAIPEKPLFSPGVNSYTWFCLNSGNSGPIASSDTMDRTCILELIILVIKNILQTYSDEVLVTWNMRCYRHQYKI